MFGRVAAPPPSEVGTAFTVSSPPLPADCLGRSGARRLPPGLATVPGAGCDRKARRGRLPPGAGGATEASGTASSTCLRSPASTCTPLSRHSRPSPSIQLYPRALPEAVKADVSVESSVDLPLAAPLPTLLSRIPLPVTGARRRAARWPARRATLRHSPPFRLAPRAPLAALRST